MSLALGSPGGGRRSAALLYSETQTGDNNSFILENLASFTYTAYVMHSPKQACSKGFSVSKIFSLWSRLYCQADHRRNDHHIPNILFSAVSSDIQHVVWVSHCTIFGFVYILLHGNMQV